MIDDSLDAFWRARCRAPGFISGSTPLTWRCAKAARSSRRLPLWQLRRARRTGAGSSACTSSSEAEVFWTYFLSSLIKRGLSSVQLVISGTNEGWKAGICCVLKAAHQRCQVRWSRNAMAFMSPVRQALVAAGVRSAFQQTDQDAAREAFQRMAEQLQRRHVQVKGITAPIAALVRETVTLLPQAAER